MSQPESIIVDQIVSWLRIKGCLAIIYRNGATFDPKRNVFRKPGKRFTPGVSDIIALSPAGIAIAIEVKVPGKKPTAEQAAFLADWSRRKPSIGFYADSLERVQAELAEILHR